MNEELNESRKQLTSTLQKLNDQEKEFKDQYNSMEKKLQEMLKEEKKKVGFLEDQINLLQQQVKNLEGTNRLNEQELSNKTRLLESLQADVDRLERSFNEANQV